MAPALKFPVRADIVPFEEAMKRTRSITGEATKHVIQQFARMNSAIAADLKVNSALLSGVATLGRGPLLAIAGSLGVIVGAWKALNAITELGKEKIEEYIEVSKKAAAGGVSPEFFQRAAGAAKAFGIEIDAVAASLKKLNDDTAEKLGGSGFQNRLDALVKAGNFTDNSGVSALAGANNAEERYRAVVKLITEAMQAGERLAALDLAARFASPEVLNNLRANGDALKEMQDRADKLSATKIVDEATIAQAIDLKRRLDAAHEVLANKFKPIQDDLVKLGLNYHESWVNVVQNLASAVGYASQLYNELKGIPDIFAQAANASWIIKMNAMMDRLGLNASPESMGIIDTGKSGVSLSGTPQMEEAKRRLNAGLKNRSAVLSGMQETTDIATKVRGEKSTNPTAETEETTNAFDRQTSSILKHIATMEADAEAAGLGAGKQAEFRAEAALTEALLQSGIEITDEYAEKMTKLATAAGKAADALEKAKDRAPLANFARDAANMEKQLTQASLHAFQSFENGFAEFIMGTKSASQAFSDMAKSIISDLIKIAIRQSITGPLASALFSGFSLPKFAAGTSFAPGGPAIVGENGPEIVNLPRGAQVIPNDVARRGGGGGASITNTFHVAGEVSQESVNRLERMVMRTNRALSETNRSFASARHFQATGVYGG